MKTIVRVSRGLAWLSLILVGLSLMSIGLLHLFKATATIMLFACTGLSAGFIGLFTAGAILAFTPEPSVGQRHG